MDQEKLTMTELFALFDRAPSETKWVASADSVEYLNVVLYLVDRSRVR